MNNQVVFPVEVKDPGAPVDFYINGKKVKISDRRSWVIIEIDILTFLTLFPRFRRTMTVASM